jgi:hypothetical protein
VRVAINALFYEPNRSAGTETYLRGLVPALAQAHPDLDLHVVTTRKGAAALRRDGWTDFCSLVQLPADEGQRLRRLHAEQVRLQPLDQQLQEVCSAIEMLSKLALLTAGYHQHARGHWRRRRANA